MDYLSKVYQTELIEQIYPLLKEDTKEKIEKIIKNYADKLKKQLKNYLKYLKRTFHVIVTDYLPPKVLGMTDCKGTIWIRRLYGYLKELVLRHEIIHNLHPYLSELEVTALTLSGYLKDAMGNFKIYYR